MGLDTTHNAWNGPYSSFGSWRKWLAKQAGFNLDDMEGFGGGKEWSEEMKAKDYYPLLNHSDCDGVLTPLECQKTAKFLGHIMAKGNSDGDKYMLEKCANFYMGCIDAIGRNENIEFH